MHGKPPWFVLCGSLIVGSFWVVNRYLSNRPNDGSLEAHPKDSPSFSISDEGPVELEKQTNSEKQIVEETRDQAEVEGLLEHWKQTVELRNDQLTSFDKSVLWASGGALALTVANVDKITGPSGVTGLLLSCWLAFAVSIGFNVMSYWSGSQDAEKELRKIRRAIENNTPYAHGNVYRGLTIALNLFALFLFLSGITLLLLHSYCNLMRP